MRKEPFQRNNTVVPAILQMLQTCERATTLEMHQALGYRRRYIEVTLRRMMDAGMVYVAAYEPPDAGQGKYARVFALGDRPHAKPLRRSKAELRAYKSEWQRARRASEAVIARARDMGPFGVVAAQVMA